MTATRSFLSEYAGLNWMKTGTAWLLRPCGRIIELRNRQTVADTTNE